MNDTAPAYSDILTSERSFFDEEAAQLKDEDLMIPADQIERYRHARLGPGNIAKDALFAHLLPLEGKKVLDYACGHGENSCLLAACGAEVTAFDLSPVSVAKARRRAELHGLADKIQCDVREAGKTDYPTGIFDVVVGFAVLHHLHMDLPKVYEEIARILVPEGTAVFVEPMVNSHLLRKLRPWVPVRCYATENERQMVYKDLEPLRQYFPSVQLGHFYCLERLERVLGNRWAAGLRRIDSILARGFPFLRRYYADVLVVARR